MIGRGKSLRPASGNHSQTSHPSKHQGRQPAARMVSGKVFRKNAGRPWSTAKQLG